MIKGCRKNIIHITDTGCPYFEEAYFVVRRGGDIEISEDDIVKEASKIAENASDAVKSKKAKGSYVRFAFFLYGASACSIIFGIVAIAMR